MLTTLKFNLLKVREAYYKAMWDFANDMAEECIEYGEIDDAELWAERRNKWLYKWCNVITKMIELSPIY